MAADPAVIEKTADTTQDTKTADTTTTVADKAADKVVETKTVDTTTTTAKTADTTVADTTTQAKGYWPDDWLSKVTKGDKKLEKSLGRYQSPAAVADAYINLRKRMDSGELKPALPKDAKPAEVAQWRKDNGIPDKPDGYKLDGLTIPEQDKAIINTFLETAHGKNFTPEQAKTAVESYYGMQKSNIEARAALDDEQRVSAVDALNQEWGGSFRRNVNMIEGLLAKFPAGVRDALKSARMPDGTAIFNNADAMKGFAALALELNPAGVVVPSSGGDVNKVALQEYKDLLKGMGENRSDYNKDAGKQQRMTELIEHLHKQGIIDDNGNEIVRKAA